MIYTESDLDEMAGPLRPRARTSTQRHKAPKLDEDHFHYAAAKMLSAAIARPGVLSPDRVVWFSIEGRARRSIWEGARNRRRGCVAGVPDLMILHDSGTYWMELKAAKGVLSDAQREMHVALSGANSPVAVVRTLEEVAGFLVKWQIPHRRITL